MIKMVLLAAVIFICNVYSQNFWQQLEGPNNPASVFDFLKYDDSTLFAGTGEGIIKSTDNGNSWESNFDITKPIYRMAMDSTRTLYACGTDQAGNGYVLKSTNKGNIWTKINNNFWADFRDILITYKDTIFVGSWDHGIFRTTDYGSTWAQINNGLGNYPIYKIIFSNGLLLTGTSGGGAYRSTDLGNSWAPSNTGIPVGSNGYTYVTCFLELSHGKILCGTQNGIYFSTDYGISWVSRSNGLPSYPGINDLVLDNKGNVYTALQYSGIYISPDYGLSWRKFGLSYDTHSIGLNSSMDLFAGTLDVGLYKFSFADSSWEQVYNKGYRHIRVDLLALTDSEKLFAYSFGSGALYRSTDNGKDWNIVSSGAYLNDILSIDDTTIVFGTSSGVYLTTNSGDTWGKIAGYYVSTLYYDHNAKILYVGTNHLGNGICGVYSTNDLGKNWNLISELPGSAPGKWLNVVQITNKSNHIFTCVGYGDPKAGTWHSFMGSTDYGISWSIINEDNVIDINENYHGNLYALGNGNLYISHDEGLTWNKKNIYNLNQSVASDYKGKIYYMSSVAYTIYLTAADEDGNNETIIKESIPEIYDLAVTHNNIIYAATEEGIYRGDANNIVLNVKDKITNPNSYSLSQNYPNPFNPNTTIFYSVPTVSNVKLVVYNTLGQTVKVLENGFKNSGSYSVNFNSDNLPSGVYFYKLVAGQFSQVKKMMLLK